MRKKIGKRIGPVPIALVAVFALAAFISAGLLLAVPSGQTAEAQGLPTATPNPIAGETCTVIVQGDGAVVTGTVSGGGCTTGDDSVDVKFQNTDETPANTQSMAIYVTGGELFSSLQATDETGKPLGAVGLDEKLVTVKVQTTGVGNVKVRGSETVTVSRDMAKNGQVYLFVYFTDDETTKDFTVASIPLSGLVDDDVRDRETETAVLVALSDNGDIIRDITSIRAAAVAFEYDHDGVEATVNLNFLDDDDLPAAFTVVESNNQLDNSDEDDLNVIRADVDPEQEALDTAAAIVRAIKDADGYEAFFKDAGTNEATIATLEQAIRETQAAVDAIDGGDPDYMPNSLAPLAVKVVFTNAAAEAKLKKDGTYGETSPGEGDTHTLGSTLFIGRGSLTSNETLSDGATTADVEANIRDARGIGLSGFVRFSVDTTAAGAVDALFEDSTLSTQRIKLDAKGKARVQVTDLEKNVALKIPVTVSYGSDFEMMGYIVREGDALIVEATAYACEADKGDGAEGDVCDSEIEALDNSNTSDDPDEVVALGPNQSFVIAGKATDSVGNNVGKGMELSWKITADADNADDAEDTLDDDSGKTLEMISVKGDDDAVPGVYSLTVTSPDGEASTVIMITVSDVASMISVTCEPEMIPTDSGLTDCAVMVTDAAGNIPSNLHAKEDEDGDGRDMVRVAVRSTDVTISGVNATKDAELTDEGMASFSILLREDAPEGSITVFVSTDIGDEMLRASTSVMYGDPAPPNVAPMAGAAVADQMVYVGAEVMVQSNFSDADMDTLSYMASSSDEMVATATVDDMGMVTITGVAEGMATITVTASDPMGAYAMQTIMVSVMMMPPMELGAPSITSVMSDAEGMATVMLMPGDNATKHWAWAAPTDGSEGMWHGDSALAGDATTVTFSGLTSDMNYWFIAIAGRGTGTDSEWSAWSGWTAETPVQ